MNYSRVKTGVITEVGTRKGARVHGVGGGLGRLLGKTSEDRCQGLAEQIRLGRGLFQEEGTV